MDGLVRCQWAVEHPELLDYHDNVWGKPTHDDREIFAAYAQCVLHAGLLWTAMLKKRPVFKAAFDDWQIKKIAAYDGADIDRLMHTEGMMRNFQKINAVINNAGKFQSIAAECGSFANYVWQFTHNVTLDETTEEGRAREVAEGLALDLKKRGFKFAGPATAFGLMQDIGMVNSHDTSCFRSIASSDL